MFYNIFYARIRYLQSFLITIVQTANSKLSHTHFEIEAARDGITHIVLNTVMTRKDSGNQTLKRKCMISPSCTRYSFPSTLIFPASFTALSDPYRI